MEFLFDSSKVHDISYEQIKQLYLDNRREERLSNKMTASSYRGETFYDQYDNFNYAFRQECLERDPRTSGMRMYYPHGVVIEQAARKNYYRGENQIYEESLPTLQRKLKAYHTTKDKELYRLVADMRVAEFKHLMDQFSHVKEWNHSDVLYEALAQHYGLETSWLDITNDFNVALFFATCYWKDGKWHPLTKEETEQDENHRYGMIFHMPSFVMGPRWMQAIYDEHFSNWTQNIVGQTEDGNNIHELLEYPIYRGEMENLIYPLGFQPFMRCHMQNGYGIYMRTPQPLQYDSGFEKLRFRHNEELSKRVFEMMKGGELIYPHEGLKQAEFLIDQIKSLTVFSEEAFQYALYRSHYYRLEDAQKAKEALSQFKMAGNEDKVISIQSAHPWHISSGRRKKIDDVYADFSVEQWYQIMVLDRRREPGPNPLFEPWMIPEKEDGEGVTDFRIRSEVECGSSIVDRDMMRILDTVEFARLPDF